MSARDPACYDAAKRPEPSSHVPLLVVGAGAAGSAAAIAAAKFGILTTLVEEQPVPAELMALDVPLHFGQRMARASGNARLMEQILATSPEIDRSLRARRRCAIGRVRMGDLSGRLDGPRIAIPVGRFGG